MEGSFGNDWFIDTGTEFYRNGVEFKDDGTVKKEYRMI